jgi:hypothetical protein
MLEGLGEPFRQVREFIKDLWFRNRQERRHGELDLLDRQLELAAKYGLLDSEEGRAAALTLLAGQRSRAAVRERPPELPGGDDEVVCACGRPVVTTAPGARSPGSEFVEG